MFIEMLATESRMIVHTTVSTIEALVFGSPSIKVENLLDPLHILLLVFLGHRLLMDHWTRRITALTWIQEGLFHVRFTNVFPLQSLFTWIRSICWVRLWMRLNTLGTLGGSSGPILAVFAFPCPCFFLSLGTGLGVPSMEGFDTCFPEFHVSQLENLNHAPVLVTMIDKVLAILLWTQDILLVPLICWKAKNLALLPCLWYLGETFCLGEHLIENIEHVDHILELDVL